MSSDEDAVLIPVDEVAWQNEMYMAQGAQVCVGYDGVVRPFTIPLSVRKLWAQSGEKNPYTNRVETELLRDNVPASAPQPVQPAAAEPWWMDRFVFETMLLCLGIAGVVAAIIALTVWLSI